MWTDVCSSAADEEGRARKDLHISGVEDKSVVRMLLDIEVLADVFLELAYSPVGVDVRANGLDELDELRCVQLGLGYTFVFAVLRQSNIQVERVRFALDGDV
jgi:hypothetical protein